MPLVLPLRISATMTPEQHEWLERTYARLDSDTRYRLWSMLDAREPVQECIEAIRKSEESK